MNDPFFNSSKKIVDNFLQNVVFIDDQAFPEIDKKDEKANEFNARKVTSAFAKNEKLCIIYQPESTKDIDNLTKLVKKADVTVLDWIIEFEEEELLDGNDEEDAEEIDQQGSHTRKIISEILSDPITGKGSLKLILIYTGEQDLNGITNTIHAHLEDEIGGFEKSEADCSVYTETENIKILVRMKENGDQFKHSPNLKNKIVSYDRLPDFILDEFTEMTSGLLTTFVLKSLTAIRTNTFRLIKLYEKDLDASFVAHRLLLPNQEDSKEQLIEMLTHSIEALLLYNKTGEATSLDRIKKWIDTRKIPEKTIDIGKKKLNIDRDFLKTWAENGFVEACKILCKSKGFKHTPEDRELEKKKEKFYQSGKIHVSLETGCSDSKFSILTHQKSNLKPPSRKPSLTLGTLIKQETDSEGEPKEGYYMCIQARCDSVRLDKLRKFLFLPLKKEEDGKNFHFVVEENENEFTKLRIMKETFELRTIKFEPDEIHRVVIAKESNDKFYFMSDHKEKFQWLADLKEAHAQREINNFAAKISRVGLDESEWLRRKRN